MNRRTVFFVSDQTGVTAETMGHSLLTQFEGLEFRQVTLPFISSVDKAVEAVRKIDATATADGLRPVVFSTLVKGELRSVVKRSNGLFLDFFDAFMSPLETELEVKSSEREGRAHGIADRVVYSARIDATNFALAADDGGVIADYSRADVILVGVSRSGKTPTCIYMAMQYGVYAANYPLTEDDFEAGSCPRWCDPYPQAVRPHHRAAAAEADPQRAPARQPIRLRGAVRFRGAQRRGAVPALRGPPPQHHRVLDRGDREPDHRAHGDRAQAASVSRVAVVAQRHGREKTLCYSRTMIADSLCVTSWRARPASFVGLMTLYESNYVRLRGLAGDLRALAGRHVSRVPSDCDLHLDAVEHSPYTTVFRLTYFFEDAPGVVADPDLEVRVYHDARLAEASRCGRWVRHPGLASMRSRLSAPSASAGCATCC